jgi:arsenical pump membrane protein
VPAPLIDVVAVLALVVMLAVAFLHPPSWLEALIGAGAAGTVLAVGALSVSGAEDQLRLLLPVVAFLAAILVVAELCAVEGVFTAVGALVAGAGRGSPRRILGLTFVAAAATTAALSLDSTVVLLTPVVATAASRSLVGSRPMVYACARLANSASVLLPVSNLTNLLALPSLPSLSFAGFAIVMTPVWIAVIGVEYVGHRLFFRRDLSTVPESPPAARDVALPVVPLVVVGFMLVGFAALSPFDVAPAWVAAAAALVLAGWSLRRRRVTRAALARSTHAGFAVFVLCLGVVVAGVSDSFLGDLVAHAVPDSHGLGALLVVALLATLLANLVNNLPATLLLVPLVAPLGQTAVLAALLGLGVGSSLTYAGSLANLLWRRTLRRHGLEASTRTFHALSALVTLPAVVTGVVVLWAWAPVVR